MKDKSRIEAIQWIIDNKVDFNKGKFPPPEGWMWAENEPGQHLTLTAIHTHFEGEEATDIDPIDLLFETYNDDLPYH